METTMTPNGPPDENGVVPMTQGVSFKITAVAEGQRREDGLTAAQVEQELREREAH